MAARKKLEALKEQKAFEEAVEFGHYPDAQPGKIIEICYGRGYTGPAELLGGELARIVAPAAFADLWEGDIVRLANVNDDDGHPMIKEIVSQRYPCYTDIEYPADARLGELFSLLKALGADCFVGWEPEEDHYGVLRVAHDEWLDVHMLAESIGFPHYDYDACRTEGNEVPTPATVPSDDTQVQLAAS
jgi:hypothetical protein